MVIEKAVLTISSSQLTPKFIRRHDLTFQVRLALVFESYTAQINKEWGVISELTRQYGVSRTFIYDLLAIFKEGLNHLLFPQKKSTSISRADVEARILSYRFEGRASIDAISTLLKRDALPFSAHGLTSEFLTHVGKMLSNTLENAEGMVSFIAFADDEVFAKSRPILITVDPVSSAILRIELVDKRTAAKWANHRKCLLDNGFEPNLITSDAGTAICADNKDTLKEIDWQLDTFHSIAHRLGLWDRKLHKAIETAINYAADREDKLNSAKSDAVIDKRLTLCFEAEKAIIDSRERSENFHYLYCEIIQQLNSFDSQGNLRTREEAENTINAALDLMEELDYKPIKKPITSVRNALPDCLTYFENAQQAVKNCDKLSDNKEALSALYLAWQWEKVVIKSKDTERKHKAIEQRDTHLTLAALFIDNKEVTKALKEDVYKELDQIIQASSLVECINSLLRPYLNNSRNQVTQEFLNTFMFYHNHRRYHAGKRKNKTPMELLTGKEQKEDWISLLQAKVKEQEIALLA